MILRSISRQIYLDPLRYCRDQRLEFTDKVDRSAKALTAISGLYLLCFFQNLREDRSVPVFRTVGAPPRNNDDPNGKVL